MFNQFDAQQDVFSTIVDGPTGNRKRIDDLRSRLLLGLSNHDILPAENGAEFILYSNQAKRKDEMEMYLMPLEGLANVLSAHYITRGIDQISIGVRGELVVPSYGDLLMTLDMLEKQDFNDFAEYGRSILDGSIINISQREESDELNFILGKNILKVDGLRGVTQLAKSLRSAASTIVSFNKKEGKSTNSLRFDFHTGLESQEVSMVVSTLLGINNPLDYHWKSEDERTTIARVYVNK